mmetsp:Transcript_15897/g.24498  ORF Transcript_15897/g.24498 Transcript_15897/m.24498 type:complete len:114 (+) Transcript_15897:62-403(+)
MEELPPLADLDEDNRDLQNIDANYNSNNSDFNALKPEEPKAFFMNLAATDSLDSPDKPEIALSADGAATLEVNMNSLRPLDAIGPDLELDGVDIILGDEEGTESKKEEDFEVF